MNRLKEHDFPDRLSYEIYLDGLYNALNCAAYALYEIKRMPAEVIPEYASRALSKACKVLDNED